MSHKQHKFLVRDGFTLIEVIIAMLALAVIALGALNYQYYAALHGRTALAQMTAIRTAQLLIDDWKSVGGSVSYDPTSLALGFADPDLDATDYAITVDGLPMLINMSYNDIEHDDEAEITIRKIIVQVNWRNDHTAPTGQVDEDISMELSTYVRLDASGG